MGSVYIVALEGVDVTQKFLALHPLNSVPECTEFWKALRDALSCTVFHPNSNWLSMPHHLTFTASTTIAATHLPTSSQSQRLNEVIYIYKSHNGSTINSDIVISIYRRRHQDAKHLSKFILRLCSLYD